MVLSAECSLFEGWRLLLCLSLDVLFGGLGIGKLQCLKKIFFLGCNVLNFWSSEHWIRIKNEYGAKTLHFAEVCALCRNSSTYEKVMKTNLLCQIIVEKCLTSWLFRKNNFQQSLPWPTPRPWRCSMWRPRHSCARCTAIRQRRARWTSRRTERTWSPSRTTRRWGCGTWRQRRGSRPLASMATMCERAASARSTRI